MQNIMHVLNGVKDIFSTEYCYKGQGGGESSLYHPPESLMAFFHEFFQSFFNKDGPETIKVDAIAKAFKDTFGIETTEDDLKLIKEYDALEDGDGALDIHEFTRLTLMEMIKNKNAATVSGINKIFRMLTPVDVFDKILKRYVSVDLDLEEGTASWMQAKIWMGTPLPGYNNASHFEDEQNQQKEFEFLQSGPLGNHL